MSEAKLIELTTLAERERFEQGCWHMRCAQDGVTPEEIAAGTATLDRNGRGRPVFPPRSTKSATPSFVDGDRALYVVSDEMQRWQGGSVQVPGHGEVTHDVSAARTRTQVEADPRWTDKVRPERAQENANAGS